MLVLGGESLLYVLTKQGVDRKKRNAAGPRLPFLGARRNKGGSSQTPRLSEKTILYAATCRNGRLMQRLADIGEWGFE